MVCARACLLAYLPTCLDRYGRDRVKMIMNQDMYERESAGSSQDGCESLDVHSTFHLLHMAEKSLLSCASLCEHSM